jgi:hypothetical protein
MDGAEGVGLVQDSWTEVDGDPTGGAHLSVDEIEGEDTLSGFVRLGLRLDSRLGRIGPLRPFYIFYFIFRFCDLIHSLFANFIQTNSNKVINYSNIYCNVLNQ